MGKSAIQLVLSQMQVVDPAGDQPAYARGRRAFQKSPRLIWHQECVRKSYKPGQEFASRAEARAELKRVSADCARRNPKKRDPKAVRAKERWGGTASSE